MSPDKKAAEAAAKREAEIAVFHARLNKFVRDFFIDGTFKGPNAVNANGLSFEGERDWLKQRACDLKLNFVKEVTTTEERVRLARQQGT